MKQLLVFLLSLFCGDCFLVWEGFNSSGTLTHSASANYKNCGEALFLTPSLEKSSIRQARKLSRVRPDIGGTNSYSGYFTVNKECESNLFFWFFPAQKNWLAAPVVLWLQGGPGASSLFGLFEEIGPFSYVKGVENRTFSWNVENNLLFIDQPVGTGYSFTGKGCYASSEEEVSKDLYNAIVQFYKLFPEINNNKFVITGESYAGHYIPALGYRIHKTNPYAKVKINFSGMMIGNGWMDSGYQGHFGEYLYQLGLIDDAAKEKLRELGERFTQLLYKKDWISANILLRYMNKIRSIEAGEISVYNYLKQQKDVKLAEHWPSFVQLQATRKQLQVGNQPFYVLNRRHVFDNLIEDHVQSVKPMIEELLEFYPIVFYFGQLDIICAYPMGVQVLRSLRWSEAADYLDATRHQWCVEGQLAGYYKSSHNLHEVLVRDAGHMVPHDQPSWAYVLANSVASGSPTSPLHALTRCPGP